MVESRRISIGGVVAQTGGSLVAAATVLLSASIAFASPDSNQKPGKDGSTGVLAPGTLISTRDLDLPIAPPSLNMNEDPPTLDHVILEGLKRPKVIAPPAPQPARGGDDPHDGPPPTFFGEEIPVRGDSIIYVVDISGSMSLTVEPFLNEAGIATTGNRLDRAKVELRRSIGQLPESFAFNVVVYDECVRTMWNGTQKATAGNKEVAFAWIAALMPLGWTNTGLAVATALGEKGNLSVVLLSDGAPNFLDCAMNYVGSYDQHRELIRGQNTQGARVNAFGIGVDGDPAARSFMQAVAADSGGSYFDVR